MTHPGRGFLDFITELSEPFGYFRVVARLEQRVGEAEGVGSDELPVLEVFADGSDKEICILRGGAAGKAGAKLRLGDFRTVLEDLIVEHPDYSLMISEMLSVGEEFEARGDFPLRGADVDEEREVVILLF